MRAAKAADVASATPSACANSRRCSRMLCALAFSSPSRFATAASRASNSRSRRLAAASAAATAVSRAEIRASSASARCVASAASACAAAAASCAASAAASAAAHVAVAASLRASAAAADSCCAARDADLRWRVARSCCKASLLCSSDRRWSASVSCALCNAASRPATVASRSRSAAVAASAAAISFCDSCRAASSCSLPSRANCSAESSAACRSFTSCRAVVSSLWAVSNNCSCASRRWCAADAAAFSRLPSCRTSSSAAAYRWAAFAPAARNESTSALSSCTCASSRILAPRAACRPSSSSSFSFCACRALASYAWAISPSAALTRDSKCTTSARAAATRESTWRCMSLRRESSTASARDASACAMRACATSTAARTASVVASPCMPARSWAACAWNSRTACDTSAARRLPPGPVGCVSTSATIRRSAAISSRRRAVSRSHSTDNAAEACTWCVRAAMRRSAASRSCSTSRSCRWSTVTSAAAPGPPEAAGSSGRLPEPAEIAPLDAGAALASQLRWRAPSPPLVCGDVVFHAASGACRGGLVPGACWGVDLVPSSPCTTAGTRPLPSRACAPPSDARMLSTVADTSSSCPGPWPSSATTLSTLCTPVGAQPASCMPPPSSLAPQPQRWLGALL